MGSKASTATELFPNRGRGRKPERTWCRNSNVSFGMEMVGVPSVFSNGFTPRLVRWAPPGSSLWTLKLERVCMPESEWWSLRSFPLTLGAWGGGGEEKATMAVQVYLIPLDSQPPRYKINKSPQSLVSKAK